MLFKKKKNKLDKYSLYQQSVQSAEVDAEFLKDTFLSISGRPAELLREDFSGTCLLSLNWVLLDKQHQAECVDNDNEPLEWGWDHNIAKQTKSVRQRIHQFHSDAREPSGKLADIRCAQNFSYWIFKTRTEMLDYFRTALTGLVDDGIFVIDLHGGPDSLIDQEEETVINAGSKDEFTYVWDQHNYNPINSHADLSIHFRFPDGSEMRDAFNYSWRVWGLAELRDILYDAGFNDVNCYWEGTSEDGKSGNGIFKKAETGESCPAYIAYLVASQ